MRQAYDCAKCHHHHHRHCRCRHQLTKRTFLGMQICSFFFFFFLLLLYDNSALFIADFQLT